MDNCKDNHTIWKALMLTIINFFGDLAELFGKTYYNFVKELPFMERMFGLSLFYFVFLSIIYLVSRVKK